MLKQPVFKKVKFGQIRPWDKNPRNIKTEKLERLAKSIKEKGLFQTLTCWKEGSFYITGGGNMRWQAMKHILKWPDDREVWISLNFPENEKEKIELSLLDNMRFGQYVEQELAELTYPYIDEIELKEFDIDLKEPVNLKSIIESFGPDLGSEKEDEIPEIDDTPALTKYGDLYQLGRHRLLCGDATKEEDVKRLMRGRKADMVITSPPYFNQREYSIWKKYDDYLSDIRKAIRNIRKLAKETFACLWNIGTDIPNDIPADCSKIFRDEGFEFKGVIAWIKSGIGTSTLRSNHIITHYLYYPKFRWEPIYIFITRNYPHFEKEDVNYVNQPLGDIWEINQVYGSQQEKIGHIAIYPIELAERGIRSFSLKGSIIYEPFLGSGTTLVACERFNRICYGIEIEPKYCDVIIKRYSNFTGIPEEEIRATKESK